MRPTRTSGTVTPLGIIRRTSMNPLDPMTVPLEKRLLIEASAGTGKTYTISLLYLRLLLDQSLTVDQILVVTYTHAATDELRLRILNRLKEAVTAYENPELASNEYLRLLEQYPSTPERILILKRGLLNFDEASIYTIHSFCQRALKENAFDVGMPFESELINDEQELLINLADSFWHRHLLKPNALQEAVIRHKGCTPDKLLAVVKPYIGRPYLDRQPQVSIDKHTYEVIINELSIKIPILKKKLEVDGDEAINLLKYSLSQKIINGKIYSEDSITKAYFSFKKAIELIFVDNWEKISLLLTSEKIQIIS